MHAGSDSIDISSTVTRLKRLSMTLPEREQSFSEPLSFNRLMDLSVERIEVMARSQEEEDLMIAGRLLENTGNYCRWEAEHSQRMQRVARHARAPLQCHELLSSTFELIHRKSFFAHLRQHHVFGLRREQLARHFFAQQDYVRGMVTEHGVFLRSSASLACSSYLGADLLLDAVFEEPLLEYEELYASYFDAYCESVLAPEGENWSAVARSVAYSLKRDLAVLRRTIFELTNRMSVHDARSGQSGTWLALPHLK